MNFLGTDLIRASDGLSAFEPPAWVPEGALVHLDFVGNRYWSAVRGIVTAADLLDGDIDWWLGSDGPDQLLDIVPGVGLTTGPTSSSYSVHGFPFLTPTTYAEVTGAGGFALAAEVEGSSTSALTGFNSWAFYCVIADKPEYQPVADAWIGRNASGGKAQFGDNWTTYQTQTSPDDPMRLAIDFDTATDKWIGAVNGDPMNALDGVTNMAAAQSIGIGASAGGTGNSVTSTVKFVTFYPRKIQAELNALSQRRGDVVGPATSTNNAVALFDGSTGDRIKSSTATIDTDATLAADSDNRLPTQKAVKTYVDNLQPAWVPDGALMVVDFAEGNYWRQDIGVCAVTDIIPSGATFNPATSIVPGIGLTTGDRTGETQYGQGGYITAGAYALLSGGFSFRMDFDIAVTTTQTGNDWVYTQVGWWDAGFNQELLANAYVGNAGTKYLRAEVYNFAPGSSSDVADTTIASGPYDAFAANFDPAAGTVLMSRDGVTQDSAVYASTYSGLSQVLIWANYEPSGSGTFTGNASMRKLVFYPQMDQTELNALSQRRGNVTGPASATDNAVVRFNGPTGKDVQSGPVGLTDDSWFEFPDLAAVHGFRNGSVRLTFRGGPGYDDVLVQSATGSQTHVAMGGDGGVGARVAVPSNGLIGFTSATNNALAARDTAFSRLSAGVVALGNGTLGDFSGSLKLTTLTFADGNTMTAADLAKLDGIETAATANSPDATLLARANHTGTQAAATISDFAATSRAETEAALIAGTNVTITPAGSGATRTLTIAASGGGESPGGASGELQFNNGGGFAGAANAEIEGGNLKLVSTTDPAAPAGGVLLYSKSIAGRHLPKIIGPSGIDTVMQVGLHGNSVFMFGPASGTTAPVPWGGTLTTAATMSMQLTVASANPWLATQRKRWQSAATAGSSTGCRTAYVQWFRGNAAGFGGFFFRTQFGQNLNVNGAQMFVGLCASTGALATTAGAASALLNMIGVGYDTTDANTGNWQLFRNDGSGTATKVDLGATNAARNTTHGFDLIIHCPPGAATEIFVRIVNIHTGAVVLDTSYTTDLPAVNTGMAFKAECNNGAVASAQNIEIAKVYIESDY